MSENIDNIKGVEWHHKPDVPIETNPLFQWPWNFRKIFHWYASVWLSKSERLFMLITAVLVWHYLTPSLESYRGEIDYGAYVFVYIRDLLIFLIPTSFLHLYFHTYKKQGNKLKFDPREFKKTSKRHNFNNQLLDNIFWSIVSGVSIWVIMENAFLWAFANQYIGFLKWDGNEIWFIALFIFLPFWDSFHFYIVHRFLHTRPMYKWVHSLHHRNVNVGPFSGISMHPVEHVIYFSAVFIHLVIPSHPIHVFFHFYWLTIGAATSHTGYEALLAGGKKSILIGFFHHQLHHRYFECNYGNAECPMDNWMGSFHDGTDSARKALKKRLQARGQ